jgi:hypothetical protein
VNQEGQNTAARVAAPQHASTQPRDVRALYRKHFNDRRKERRLISTGSFFLTFASVRAITHAIRAERGPFRNITPGGRHIHHMTFGITGLLAVGYLWMLEIGIAEPRLFSRVTAALYGSGAALTLDEFALWLNLEDDYWSRQGRESIDAVALFGSLLGLSAIGRGFLSELLTGTDAQQGQGHTGEGPGQRHTGEGPGQRHTGEEPGRVP